MTGRELRVPWLLAAVALAACGQTPSPPADTELTRPWTAARERGVDFRAVGQEPGWFLEIDEGRQMQLLYDYGERRLLTPAPRSESAGATMVYEGASGTRRLRVVIAERECHDAMSGEAFTHAVTVAFDGRELRGCGRRLTAR